LTTVDGWPRNVGRSLIVGDGKEEPMHHASRRLFLRGLVLSVPALKLGRPAAAAGESGHAVLVGPEEPGQRLVVSGRIVRQDGAPAAGVRLSVYHTDSEGYYTRPVSDPRRARIRGVLVTDPGGRYELRTILPGRYPDRRQEAHIHVHLEGAGTPEHWIESFLFEGDPCLRADDLATSRQAGAFGHVMALQPTPGGGLRARRDIRIDIERAQRNRLVDGWYR
jgi:protocatechuate 3,4-dioxygenase beta subunit